MRDVFEMPASLHPVKIFFRKFNYIAHRVHAAKAFAIRGLVTLTGQVASVTEQQSVGAIVRAIPGVRTVFFSLSIEDQEDSGGLP